MLFADDIVLLSSTPTGLQNQLDSLARASDSLGQGEFRKNQSHDF
jgi:hypothetical protein